MRRLKFLSLGSVWGCEWQEASSSPTTVLRGQPYCCLGNVSFTEFLVLEHGIATANESRTEEYKFPTDHSSALQWNFPTRRCDSKENQGLKEVY